MEFTAFPLHATIIGLFVPSNYTPSRSTSKQARAHRRRTVPESQLTGKRFSDHSPNHHGVQISAGDEALLDARDGEPGVEALGARLGAVHDRVAAIQLEAAKAARTVSGEGSDVCEPVGFRRTCR